MWISKKEWESLRGEVSALNAQVTRAGKELQAQAPDLDAKLAGLRTAVAKHDLAIEDMLESWEEWQDKLNAQEEKQAQRMNNEAADFRRRENALVSLLISYHDQFFALRRAAEESGDGAWSRQFSAATDKLAEDLALAGLQVIEQPGAAFSYALHDAVRVIETEDKTLHMRVAQVYSCGYLYQGQTLRKAKIAVYQYKEAQA